ncbi:metallophosphoesterase [Cytobacillus sp. FSL R5-0569]|uniref:metallophosphoesterase n=1 Tax=Cytobacillus TaxID=2675230 RepID=UPI00278890AE|nr:MULTISPECIES: metallophosphoesterase [Cytobacillus]MDQ0183890.1 putative MPP superfamily phosphohydrolase [Cytobacillus kochii]MEA1852920.1 metallophosphoesterase [Cytobacillus sp. OWB-43]
MYIILAGALLFISVGVVVYMYKEAHKDTIEVRKVAIQGFPESLAGLNIFFISDIHRRELSGKLIQAVKDRKVDIVCIGGDLTEKGVPLARTKRNIENLVSIAPTYFVWGNNDYEVDFHELDALLLDLGVKILDNSAVSFEGSDGKRIVLLGTDDFSRERDQIDLAIEDAGNGCRILMSHDPGIVDYLLPEYQISFMMSGHTHGGQIRILNWGPYEKGGMKYKNGIPYFVSNGYGTTALPLRLGAPAQTHILSLYPSLEGNVKDDSPTKVYTIH